jgi:hypothetical protein
VAGLVLAGGLLVAPPASAGVGSVVTKVAVASSEAARPRNGAVLYDRISGGEGTLKVKNGTAKDAVVTLVRGKSKAISLYVRAKSSASYRGVSDGTYRVFFTNGSRYSVSKHRFGRSAAYWRFDDRVRFTTTATSASIWTLTLHVVRGGNARAHGINPKDFPA